MFVVLTATFVSALDFADESLSYKVKYKWGLIQKQAGHATLTLSTRGNEYIAQLTAASERWADRFFMVRDTLNGVMERGTLRPKFYEKIAHEGKDDKHDTVKFIYDGNIVKGICTRKVFRDGQERVNTSLVLTAEGTTVDMITAYYYMRAIPYETWTQGQEKSINIFSGKRKELLTIRYHGIEEIKGDKSKYSCYHITFIFTSDGGKKTSDDMDAWISADARRIPIKLEGKLPVGKVQCFYSGS